MQPSPKKVKPEEEESQFDFLDDEQPKENSQPKADESSVDGDESSGNVFRQRQGRNSDRTTESSLPIIRKPVCISQSGPLTSPKPGDPVEPPPPLTDSSRSAKKSTVSRRKAAQIKPSSGDFVSAMEVDVNLGGDDWPSSANWVDTNARPAALAYDEPNGNAVRILGYTLGALLVAGGTSAAIYSASSTETKQRVGGMFAGLLGNTESVPQDNIPVQVSTESTADAVAEVQRSNTANPTNNPTNSIYAQFQDNLARVQRLVDEGSVDEAKEVLESMDRVVYGYGAPEFKQLEAQIAAWPDGAPAAEADADRVAAAEAERVAAVEAERIAAVEAERVAAVEAERVAAVEAERVAAAEAERVAAVEAERVAAVEAERVAAVEAERVAAVEAERVAAVEAERVAVAEAERLASVEAERVAAVEAERVATIEAERVAEEARVAAAAAELIAAAEAERVAAAEAARVAEAERIAVAEAERIALADAELRAAAEAERVALADAELRAAAEAERIALEDAERISTAEAERVALADAERRVAAEAERVALAEAERNAAAEADRVAAAEVARQAGLAQQAIVSTQIAEAEQIRSDRVAQERARKEQLEIARQQRERQERESQVALSTVQVPAQPDIIVAIAETVDPASQPINDADLERVYGQFAKLQKAIENRDINSVIELTERSGKRIQQVLQMFENNVGIDAQLRNVSTLDATGEIQGTLQITRLERADGSITGPPLSLGLVRLSSIRRGDGWSLIRW